MCPARCSATCSRSSPTPTGPFSFTRPDTARLERAARDLGIDDDVAVVVYDSSVGQWAARLWWLLMSAGVDRVAVLDGGLTRWRTEEREVETGFEPPRNAGALTLAPREGFWADRDEVRRHRRGRRRMPHSSARCRRATSAARPAGARAAVTSRAA